MKYLLLIVLTALLSFSIQAYESSVKGCVKQWEYFSKNYSLGFDDPKTANWRISAGFTKAGKEGWELVNVLPLGKQQYAIFKRQKNVCVDAALLNKNTGLKRP